MASIGIGFRRDFASEFTEGKTIRPDFIEVAPENWISIGGYWKKIFDEIASSYPVYTHGLSLSIGSPDPIDFSFLGKIREFLDTYKVRIYSEHLSFSKADNAHLYDLLPIPFRKDAVRHVSERIQRVQDFLRRKIAIEIVSYYTPVAAEMSESEFICAIVEKSGCELLLDVNNIYVNGFNHGYDPKKFIDTLPLDKVAYIHMAGHEQVAPDLIIDTHGEPIIQPVYELFDYAIRRTNPVPVLLERDFNIPEAGEMQQELNQLRQICETHWNSRYEPVIR